MIILAAFKIPLSVEQETLACNPPDIHDWVTSVAFSPDSSRVVSGSYDGTVRISFSPGGIQVVSGSGRAIQTNMDAGSGAPIGKPRGILY